MDFLISYSQYGQFAQYGPFHGTFHLAKQSVPADNTLTVIDWEQPKKMCMMAVQLNHTKTRLVVNKQCHYSMLIRRAAMLGSEFWACQSVTTRQQHEVENPTSKLLVVWGLTVCALECDVHETWWQIMVMIFFSPPAPKCTKRWIFKSWWFFDAHLERGSRKLESALVHFLSQNFYSNKVVA